MGAALTLLVVVSAGGLGVWAVLAPMFVIVSGLAFVLPNSDRARAGRSPRGGGDGVGAAGRHPVSHRCGVRTAGRGRGPDTAVPMGVVMATLAIGALFAPACGRGAAPLAVGGMTLITVSASYGAGGSRVAPALARRLAVPFLGRPPDPVAGDDEERCGRTSRRAGARGACSRASPRWVSPGGRPAA